MIRNKIYPFAIYLVVFAYTIYLSYKAFYWENVLSKGYYSYEIIMSIGSLSVYIFTLCSLLLAFVFFLFYLKKHAISRVYYFAHLLGMHLILLMIYPSYAFDYEPNYDDIFGEVEVYEEPATIFWGLDRFELYYILVGILFLGLQLIFIPIWKQRLEE